MIARVCLLFMLFYPWAVSAVTDNESLRVQIQLRVEQVSTENGLEIEGEPISSRTVLPTFYERRGYFPAWLHQQSVDQLFDVLEHIDADGLDPQDYHLAALEKLRSQIADSADPDETQLAEFDILLSDALTRLGYHMLIGKVDPEDLDSNWNMPASLGSLDEMLALSGSIEDQAVEQMVESLRPDDELYRRLKKALQEYREIQAGGGWQGVAEGDSLKPGRIDARVVALCKRLQITGDIRPGHTCSPELDETVENGVIAFQKRHGLDADGIAGKATIAAMNVPVDKRVDQIRVNLERARWVLRDLPDDFVLVDIAGFNVSYIRDKQIVWQTRAQVGKPFRATPVFRSEIKYMVMNPTWTVPPTILENDVLPKIRTDPGYLAKKNMRVIDHSGKPVNAASINWSKYPGEKFPYMIRQDPGPANALGRIKFMFPNKHLVYLHDTPSRSLFGRSERAFSSGCIRVERPYEFAELLLDDREKWSEGQVVAAVDSLETRSVSLPKPVTVILLYWTVNVDKSGQVFFKKDIYKRDQAVLAGLEKAFYGFDKRAVLRD